MPLTRIQSLGITDGTIVNADINASAAIAGTKLTGVTSEVKAWVNFNGTGTVAIRASFNVSSITDNGAGDYTINFTNSLTDANYCSVHGDEGGLDVQRYISPVTKTTSSFRIYTSNQQTSGSIFQGDIGTIQVGILR
jgi:hypothetical protein